MGCGSSANNAVGESDEGIKDPGSPAKSELLDADNRLPEEEGEEEEKIQEKKSSKKKLPEDKPPEEILPEEEQIEEIPPDDLSSNFAQIESEMRFVRSRKTGKVIKVNAYERAKPPDDQESLDLKGLGKAPNWLSMRPCHKILTPPSVIPEIKDDEPDINYEIEYVYGFRCEDIRQNVLLTKSSKVVYITAALGIVLDPKTNKQTIFGGSSFNSKKHPTKNEHNDDVISIAINPQRDLVATGQIGTRPTLFLWNPSNGKLKSQKTKLKLLEGERGISAIAFSYDGKFFAFATLHQDHHIYIYETESFIQKSYSKGGPDKICGMCWNKKNGVYHFASVGIRHFATWDMSCKFLKPVYGIAKSTSFACVTSCDEGRYYSGGANGTLYVWDIHILSNTLVLHDGIIYSITYSKGLIFTGGTDKKINIVKSSDLSIVNTVSIEAVPQSIDTNDLNVVVGCMNGYIYLYGPQLFGGGNEIMCSHFSGELWGLSTFQDKIITSGDDNIIILWNMRSHSKEKFFIINSEAGERLRYGDYFLTKFADNQSSRTNAINYFNEEVAIGTNSGQIQIKRKVEHLEDNIRILEEPKKWISHLSYSPDGKLLAAGDHSNILYIYQVPSYELKHQFPPMNSPILSFDWNVDNNCIRLNTEGGDLIYFNIEDLTQPQAGHIIYRDTVFKTQTTKFSWGLDGIFPYVTDYTHVTAVDKYPKGGAVAVGDDWGLINLYRFPCMIKSRPTCLRGHSNIITRLKFNLEGNFLFSVGGPDKTLIQWRLCKEYY